MAFDDPARPEPPRCLASPQISLIGEVNQAMVEKFLGQLREAEATGEDIAVEISTPGGDAELGRRLLLEVELARSRIDRRFVFLGKTHVYSAGVTLMSAFPPEDRYLTRDTVLLIHCRQLDKTVEISGPMRSSIPKLRALHEQMEIGIRLEEANFRQLIEGSDISFEEVCEKALCNWYLPAEDALKRGLVAGIV
jgi:ATP-dependent protease ClpP protease subunit